MKKCPASCQKEICNKATKNHTVSLDAKTASGRIFLSSASNQIPGSNEYATTPPIPSECENTPASQKPSASTLRPTKCHKIQNFVFTCTRTSARRRSLFDSSSRSCSVLYEQHPKFPLTLAKFHHEHGSRDCANSQNSEYSGTDHHSFESLENEPGTSPNVTYPRGPTLARAGMM